MSRGIISGRGRRRRRKRGEEEEAGGGEVRGQHFSVFPAKGSGALMAVVCGRCGVKDVEELDEEYKSYRL